MDAAGNLYGTTESGGTFGGGTVFGLTLKSGGWIEGLLHSFTIDGSDGYFPEAGLIFDAAGNLYGTTGYSGTDDCGTVFGLGPKGGGHWQEGVLYSFYTKPNDGRRALVLGNNQRALRGVSSIVEPPPMTARRCAEEKRGAICSPLCWFLRPALAGSPRAAKETG